MKLDGNTLGRLRQLNASFRFRLFGPTFYAEPGEEDLLNPRLRQRDVGKAACDIVDSTTGKLYASAEGVDERAALAMALDRAENSAKPLTLAQLADVQAGRFADPVAAARIAQLETEVAELRQTQPARKSKAKP